MNTFDTIVYKIINLNNNIFSYNYNKNDPTIGLHKWFFICLIENKTIYKNKHQYFYETINNFYFSKIDEERNDLFSYFYKIQKTYHSLNRLCFLYKIKKAKLVVNSDLQLNEINVKQKNVFSIYHNNNNYLFTIQDLLKIIYSSLTNTYMFFSEPISIKNPYNNLTFEKSILYYIYLFLIQNTFIGYIKSEYIDIFLKFKKCNFNMTEFIDRYEYILREQSFENYINNSSKPQQKDDILIMLKEYNLNQQQCKIYIDDTFPENKLIEIMKPYLYLYLMSRYSLVQKNRLCAKSKLNQKLKELYKFNPTFGRKIIIYKNKIKNGRLVKYKSHIQINCRHKSFNIHDNINNFMNNHLSYKYEDNNDYEYQNSNTVNTITNQSIESLNNLFFANHFIEEHDNSDVNYDAEEDINSDEDEYDDNNSIS